MNSSKNISELIGINQKWNVSIPSLGALTLWYLFISDYYFGTIISPKFNDKSNNLIEFNN